MAGRYARSSDKAWLVCQLCGDAVMLIGMSGETYEWKRIRLIYVRSLGWTTTELLVRKYLLNIVGTLASVLTLGKALYGRSLR
jgi:hypothetical protein